MDRINALQPAPAFVLHTGDQTHGQKAGAFDTVAEILKGVKTERVFYLPGEHDVFLTAARSTSIATATGTVGGRGWQSFDYQGTHFVGLVNVLKYKGEGMGALGEEQIEWLEKDLAPLVEQHARRRVRARAAVGGVSAVGLDHRGRRARARPSPALRLRDRAERPHPPGAAEGGRRRSRFHTAMSTAFPQPAPGSAPAPGPMKIPEAEARRMIGAAEITYVPGQHPLAIVDTRLG